MSEGEKNIGFTLGVTHGGEVLVDFGKVNLNHLLLNPDQALEMAEGLVEAARDAAAGRVILTPGHG